MEGGPGLSEWASATSVFCKLRAQKQQGASQNSNAHRTDSHVSVIHQPCKENKRRLSCLIETGVALPLASGVCPRLLEVRGVGLTQISPSLFFLPLLILGLELQCQLLGNESFASRLN